MARQLKSTDLAINGGKPVHVRPWRTGPLHHAAELAALKRLLSGPQLPMARGAAVMAYREQLQDLYGVKYAIPTSSGTAALHVALSAAGVGAGDEVLLAPLTDYGSIIGILQLNAIPVFVDVTEDGMLMDVDAMAAKITPHTRAIVPIHNGGYAIDMPAVMRVARKHRIAVVEDCAQSHLATIRGKFLGTYGDLGIWSTNESKHMKSGEGGFVLTNSRKLARFADLFSDKCYPRFPGAPATPAFPALNVRLSEVNAALASVQLQRLPGWVEKRRAFGTAFLEGIANAPGIQLHPQPRGASPSFWWTMFQVDRATLGVDARRFSEMIGAEGIPIQAGPQQYVLDWEVFRRLHQNPRAFRSYNPGRLKKGSFPLDAAPNARTVDRRVCAIRITHHNTTGEARAAARAVCKVARSLSRK